MTFSNSTANSSTMTTCCYNTRSASPSVHDVTTEGQNFFFKTGMSNVSLLDLLRDEVLASEPALQQTQEPALTVAPFNRRQYQNQGMRYQQLQSILTEALDLLDDMEEEDDF